MGGCQPARWGESTLQKPLSCPGGQEGLRFWRVLRGYAKFVSFENAGCNRSHIPVSSRWNCSQRNLREAKTFRLSGCEARPFFGRDKRALCRSSCWSQETWRRSSWKIPQVALWNARRTSELGVASSKSDDCLRFQARQEQSLHLFSRRSRFANCSPWTMEIILQQPELLKTSSGSMENFQRSGNASGAVFRTARNTGNHPGHQSPEQNYHMVFGGNQTPVMQSWLFLCWAMAPMAPKSLRHLQKEP